MHSRLCLPSFPVALQIYQKTINVPNLVHCRSAPKLTKNNVYSVELVPLGYSCQPRSWADLKQALRDVLIALKGLHELSFVHRDIRWENILRSEQVSASI